MFRLALITFLFQCNQHIFGTSGFSLACGKEKQRIGVINRNVFDLKSSVFSLKSSSAFRLEAKSNDDENEIVTDEQVRYLGKGRNAIVRSGVVILAPGHEYHTHYRHAAIFIHGMGLDENDEFVIRGVVIDHPTPFTIGEMSDSTILQQEQDTGLKSNILFRGGGAGSDSAMLLHNQPHVGGGGMIGTSEIYEGGLESAMTASTENNHDYCGDNFKFFFNFCEFTEIELERMFAESVNDETGDGWIAVEVPPGVILNDWDRGKAWKRLRKAVARHWRDVE